MAKVIRIFTDGACSGNPGGPGGWAAIFDIDKQGIKILKGGVKKTTNNRMELLAVVRAIKKASNSKRFKTFEIYSDSAYVVNAVNMQWIVKWKLNNWRTTKGELVKNSELWKALDKAIALAKKKKINITFVKVKGHSGNPLNEYADTIAKQQANKQKDKLGAKANE